MPTAKKATTEKIDQSKKKVSTTLYISPHTVARGQALAVIRHEALAEIWRAALDGFGIRGLERQHAADLRRVEDLIRYTGMDRSVLLKAMLDQGLTLKDLCVPGMTVWLSPTAIRQTLGAAVPA